MKAQYNPQQMKNNLYTLIQLSEIDGQISQLNEAKTKLPLIVIEIQKHILKFNSELLAIDDKIAKLKTEQTDTSSFINEKQQWIANREAQINNIKTTKEFQASVKEIAQAKKEILDKTQSLTQLETTIQNAQNESQEQKDKINTKISELSAKLKECEEKIASVEPKISEKESQKNSLLSQIPIEIQNQYLHTQKKVQPALSNATSKICSECGNRVPPQIINQLMAGSELQNCSSCHRILYLDENLEA